MPAYDKTFPLMGIGTFIGVELDRIADTELRLATVKNTVLKALEAGYRHIDLAANYNNLEAVGDALRQAMKPISEGGLGIKREDLWLTMKSDNDSIEAINEYLRVLGVDYLDTFMLHHPYHDGIFGSEENLYRAWKKVTDIPSTLVKTFGISNCYQGHVSRLIAVCEKYHLPKPFSNEIESNLLCPNYETVEYCQKQGIQVIAYSPLGYNFTPMILEYEVLNEVARKAKATPAQIALAWHMARGVAVIPKSTKIERIQENFAATTFIDSIDAETQKLLSTMIIKGMDSLTETAAQAKLHSESLEWSVLEASLPNEPIEPEAIKTPIVDALKNELKRLKDKAINNCGFSLGWFWHINYQDKANKVEHAIKILQQNNATLSDDRVKNEIMNPESELYKALNQHTGYIFGGLLNGFTLINTSSIIASEARAILNIKAVIAETQNLETNSPSYSMEIGCR